MTYDARNVLLRIHKAMEPTRRMVERLETDAERTEAMVSTIQDVQLAGRRAVSGLATHVEANQDRYRDAVQRPLVDLIAGFRRMQERLGQLEADERELMQHLAQLGWLLSPSMPLDASRILLEVVREHGVEEVERILIDLFDPAWCRETLLDCCDYAGYAPWRTRFEEALNAHERGEYGLAIPIWLMAMDGIANQELEIQRLYSEVQRTGKKDRVSGKLRGDRAPSAHSDALRDILRSIGAHGESDGPGELRRHQILHGRDPDYAYERSSIQCIVLLESMHRYIAFRTPIREAFERNTVIPKS